MQKQKRSYNSAFDKTAVSKYCKLQKLTSPLKPKSIYDQTVWRYAFASEHNNTLPRKPAIPFDTSLQKKHDYNTLNILQQQRKIEIYHFSQYSNALQSVTLNMSDLVTARVPTSLIQPTYTAGVIDVSERPRSEVVNQGNEKKTTGRSVSSDNIENSNNNINGDIAMKPVERKHRAGRLWTSEEDYKLQKAVEKYAHCGKGGGVHWGKVVNLMGDTRTYKQCSSRWDDYLKPKILSCPNSGPWSAVEDSLLIDAVRKYQGGGKGGGISWKEVMQYLGGQRSHTQCNKRWSKTLRPKLEAGITKGHWSAEEDALLEEAMRLYENCGRTGTINWVKIVDHMHNKRSSQQCHDRWKNVLKLRLQTA